MKEKHIFHTDAEDVSDEDINIEKHFLTGDHVTQEQVDNFAYDIYERQFSRFEALKGSGLFSDIEAVLIVDALSDDRMASYITGSMAAVPGEYDHNDEIQYQSHDSDLSISMKELRPHIASLRKAIVKQMEHYFEPEEFALIAKTLKDGVLGGVKQLEGGLRHKHAVLRVAAERGSPAEHRKLLESVSKGNKTALDVLHASENVSPYILMPEAIAEKGGDMIMSTIKLENFSDELYDDAVSTQVVYEHFNQMMQLCVNLADNGLMFRDIKPDNIEIDKETGDVLVVDLDGLFKVGTNQLAMVTPAYIPPELDNKTFVETHVSEMVFQMGVVLRNLYDTRRDFIDDASKTQIVELISRMTEDVAEERIDLDQAATQVQNLQGVLLGYADTVIQFPDHELGVIETAVSGNRGGHSPVPTIDVADRDGVDDVPTAIDGGGYILSTELPDTIITKKDDDQKAA